MNVMETDPWTVVRSVVTTAVYRGRLGSGAASGPGSGQPSMNARGLAVDGGAVVGGAVVAVVVVVGAALDDAGAVAGRSSPEHAAASTAQRASARQRTARWWHGYRRGVPSRSATCVWRATPALIVALDERFGEPTDAYVNGSQTWLRDDGPGGVTLEWRLHPVASYERPKDLDTYEVFSAVALALGTGGSAPSPVDALWDGLEAFPAYGDDVEPAPLAAAVEAALGIEPDAAGLVDHAAVGDAWEHSHGRISIIDALLEQLRT